MYIIPKKIGRPVPDWKTRRPTDALGRVQCDRCKGSGTVTPSGSSERVCPRCLGRGWNYNASREAPSGSWFEPVSKQDQWAIERAKKEKESPKRGRSKSDGYTKRGWHRAKKFIEDLEG